MHTVLQQFNCTCCPICRCHSTCCYTERIVVPSTTYGIKDLEKDEVCKMYTKYWAKKELTSIYCNDGAAPNCVLALVHLYSKNHNLVQSGSGNKFSVTHKL